MNNGTMTRVVRAIALTHKISQREHYWGVLSLVAEGERLTVNCIVELSGRTLLSFTNDATDESLDELIRQLEFTKNETIEDAMDVLYHNKRGY